MLVRYFKITSQNLPMVLLRQSSKYLLSVTSGSGLLKETKNTMSSNAGLLKFIEAQQNSYSVALSEIRNGRKISHWMWYIFPQIIGLGFSETSRFYAVKNLQEAKEYMENDILSERLIKICEVLLELNTSNAHQIFGSPDDLKLKSSMTLFGEASNDPIFQKVLDKFFNGEKDVQTLKILTRG